MDGLVELNDAAKRLNMDLVALVAETALWASPVVHSWLVSRHPTGAFYPKMRRYRAGAGESRGAFTKTERLDDNSYANHAIKQAVGLRDHLTNYHACHIWPQSCYDSRCHTVVANLVLLPSPLAALSDHHLQVAAALKYRSYELFSWLPPDETPPQRPTPYPTSWRNPEPWSPLIEASLSRRRLEYLEQLTVQAAS